MNNYLKKLNTLLIKKKVHNKPLVLDLFAGCGGLSLGFECVGFKTIGFEMDKDAVKTYNNNLFGKCFEEKLTLNTKLPKADIIIGGPPCQPFSVNGYQRGLKDSRDGFPIFINAVKKLKPKVWLFENVRGMAYRNKVYLSEIINNLEKLGYIINSKILNAKKFDVPQNRERLFVLGSKKNFYFPEENENYFTSGEAISDLVNKKSPDDVYLTKNQDRYIAKYEKASNCINPRDLNLKKPARTLTCRNLAGATGDMHRVKLTNGKRRRLNIREGARLQSFPDWYKFSGSKNSIFYQIGNAVPPLLAYKIAKAIKLHLEGKNPQKNKFQYEISYK